MSVVRALVACYSETILHRTMAIHSTLLGSVTVSGEEAKAFTQKLTHARGTKAASESARNGRKMVATFAKNGHIAIKVGNKGTVHLKRKTK